MPVSFDLKQAVAKPLALWILALTTAVTRRHFATGHSAADTGLLEHPRLGESGYRIEEFKGIKEVEEVEARAAAVCPACQQWSCFWKAGSTWRCSTADDWHFAGNVLGNVRMLV